jgi:hypothetical protein
VCCCVDGVDQAVGRGEQAVHLVVSGLAVRLVLPDASLELAERRQAARRLRSILARRSEGRCDLAHRTGYAAGEPVEPG